MENGITLQAVFNKATTTIDGGWRISFDVSESDAPMVTKLALLRDSLLQVAIIPISEGVPE